MPGAALDLILVRHGLTDWNEQGILLGRSPVPLNARGHAQAAAVAAALRDVTLRAVLCSPLPRAQETAAPIARAHALTVETDPALDEVWLGRWVGSTFAEIQNDPDIRRFAVDALHTCDAFEPTVKIRDRVAEAVTRIRATYDSGAVVLVSHGDPLRILVAHHIAMALGEYRRLAIANGSISVLRFDRRGCHLRLLDWVPDAPLASRL
jgi:probable phosphoglycerate mutase